MGLELNIDLIILILASLYFSANLGLVIMFNFEDEGKDVIRTSKWWTVLMINIVIGVIGTCLLLWVIFKDGDDGVDKQA